MPLSPRAGRRWRAQIWTTTGRGTLNGVNGTSVVVDRREPWRHVVRALVSVAALVAIGYWVLVALVIAALKCDDTCGGAELDHWGWTGQVILAATGGLLGIVALIMGFGSKFRRTYRALLAVSAALAMGWVIWVLGSGEF